MTNTLFFKRAIADYIITALKAVVGLNGASGLPGIQVFIRGAFPPGGIAVPQQHYPYCEVFVATEDEFGDQPEETGGYYNQIYNGLVTTAVLLTDLALGDWIDVVESRVQTLESYDQIEEYIYYIMAELQKCEHRDMGGLELNDEAVTQFTITGPRVYGFDLLERTNTWENFGSVPFEVVTVRQRT